MPDLFKSRGFVQLLRIWKLAACYSQKPDAFRGCATRSINQPLINTNNLNIDSAPRARDLRRMDAVRARSGAALDAWTIKINAFICIDSAIGVLERCTLCVNARRDEDKYLYWRVKTRGNRNQTSISLRWLGATGGLDLLSPCPSAAPLFPCCVLYEPLAAGQVPHSNVNHCHLRGYLEYRVDLSRSTLPPHAK